MRNKTAKALRKAAKALAENTETTYKGEVVKQVFNAKTKKLDDRITITMDVACARYLYKTMKKAHKDI